jgi:hypothetical protein
LKSPSGILSVAFPERAQIINPLSSHVRLCGQPCRCQLCS